GAGRLDRAHPGGTLRVAIEAWRQNEEQGVRIARLEQCDEGGVARRAGPAARQADLHHAACGEQRQVGGGGTHLVPVGGTLDEVHLALREARAASPRPYRVGGFRREQRFVAGDEICRQQPFPEVSGERVGGELQKASCGEGRASNHSLAVWAGCRLIITS